MAIFSDGVTEAESPDGELFAVERFGGILDRERSVAANLLDCVDAVLTHSGRQQDDISLLIAQADGSRGAARLPEFRMAPRAETGEVPVSTHSFLRLLATAAV